VADRTLKFTDNADGAFYVDESCIDCDLCRVTAPECFTANEERGHSYVFKQPATPEELANSREALEACPVEAIGDDGAPVSTARS